LKDPISVYLSRRLTAYNSFSLDPVNPNVGLTVTIPCYSETHLSLTIESLLRCDPAGVDVEIIVGINQPVSAPVTELEQNKHTLRYLDNLSIERSDIKLIFSDLIEFPDRISGAGMARKVVMDEAAIRLSQSEKKTKVIACLDADCTVSPNYLKEVYSFFGRRNNLSACSIYFEHPLFDKTGVLHEPIVKYELHLRYLIQALKFTNHPHAYHTVGSSMAVNLDGYCSQWGMNKRKAGEDFYFLQKFMEIEKVGALNTTAVYPSNRKSHRVPFGTGRAMMDWENGKEILTSNMESFVTLKNFFDRVGRESRVVVNDPLLSQFLIDQRFDENSLMKNTSSNITFRRRFFRWFNAFRVMKYLHYMRQHGFPDRPIAIEARKLLEVLEYNGSDTDSVYEQLLVFRKLDRT
jgi:hypothetical protein